MRKFNNILFVLFVFLTPLFVACEGGGEAEEDLDDTTTYPVTCEINTRGTEEEGNVYENMHSVLLFVINMDGKVEAKIEKELGTTNVTKIEYEETVELTSGEKTLYGFANLTSSMRRDAGIDALKKGDTFPVNIGDATCNTNARESNIPMSNKKGIVVTKLPGQKFSIELIRLMCRIDLKITNETGYEIQLENFITAPVTPLAAPVYLMQRLTIDGVCELPIGTTPESITWSMTAPTNISLPRKIYLNESAVLNGGWFTFQLNTINRDNGDKREDRFTISNTRFINRNDILPINITLVDYKLQLDVMSYPPIGGYPSVEIPMQDKEYYAHFPGGGPFIITPKLSKYSTGEAVTTGVEWKMEVTGDTDIFDVQPVLKDGEIIGTLKYAPMNVKKALCTVNAEIEAPVGIKRILTYKVYIQNI